MCKEACDIVHNSAEAPFRKIHPVPVWLFTRLFIRNYQKRQTSCNRKYRYYVYTAPNVPPKPDSYRGGAVSRNQGTVSVTLRKHLAYEQQSAQIALLRGTIDPDDTQYQPCIANSSSLIVGC